jgi:hypothetical protein
MSDVLQTQTVATEGAFNTAIAAVDGETTAGNYTIDLSGSIGETADLSAIALHTGVTLTIDGGGGTLDGGGAYRGLFVYAGNVTIGNLTIADAAAVGGAGGTSGGGGAGLGGGLFVAGTNASLSSGGIVTLNNVTFNTDTATGGTGGPATASGAGGGGGGLGGNGGAADGNDGGGGGGIAGTGGADGQAGGAGIVPGVGSGGSAPSGATGGADGGGGGGGGTGDGGGGGGIAGATGTPADNGGDGGFGGGGGGSRNFGGTGGFGGGGGGSRSGVGASGGFGGGGAGAVSGQIGGFGGGKGGNAPGGGGGGGGGGLGAGGDIFVQQGGSLIVEGGTLSGGAVTGGAGGASSAGKGSGGVGQAYGKGVFIQANSGTQAITFAPTSGETLSIADAITDEQGAASTGGVGRIVVGGSGTVLLSAVNSYTGGTTLDGTGTLEVADGASAGSGPVRFASPTVTLRLDGGSVPIASVGGFVPGDTIDLAGVLPGNVTLASAANSGTVDGLGVSGTFAALGIVSDNNGGTFVEAACYAEGTRVATTRGEAAVEALRAGDSVRLADGGAAPVIWLGRRRVDCTRHPRPWDVWPVRVQAHAFGANRPVRDLRLSPDHAVFVEPAGVLIPVRYLINGASVMQEESAEVCYWHVELPRHAVLLAEGLTCESYLDTGNRNAFENAGTVTTLYADFAAKKQALQIWQNAACAPLVLSGPMLAEARRQLIARLPLLGHAISDDPDLRVIVDGAKLDLQRDGNSICVALPDGASELRLLSRTAVPAELDPDSEDRRRLGVPVAALRLDGKGVALGDARLGGGWHDAEPGLRWTDGTAAIDVRAVTVVELRLARLLPRYHAAGRATERGQRLRQVA